MINKISVVTLSFLLLCCELGLTQVDQKMIPKSMSNKTAFRNVTSSPSALKIQLLDPKTHKTTSLIIPSNELPQALAIKKGLKFDKLGRFKDQTAYQNFLENDYFKFMEENYGKPMALDIDLVQYKNLLFERPLSLQDLSVGNEIELVNKFFKFDFDEGSGSLKREYSKEYGQNPAFTALLIDLGFEVYWGDLVPSLFITSKKSGPRVN